MMAISANNEPLLNANLHFIDYCTAYGHTEVTVPNKAPTCTEVGLTEGKICETCGEFTVKQTAINALGHSFTDYVSDGNGNLVASCDRG